MALVNHLPEDSAFYRAARTGDRWTESQHMLAYLIDMVVFMRREAQGEESEWKPEPFPRPNDTGEKKNEAQDRMNAVHDGLMAMMQGAYSPNHITDEEN